MPTQNNAEVVGSGTADTLNAASLNTVEKDESLHVFRIWRRTKEAEVSAKLKTSAAVFWPVPKLFEAVKVPTLSGLLKDALSSSRRENWRTDDGSPMAFQKAIALTK